MKRTFWTFLVFSLFGTAAFAQPVGAGLKLGTTLTDALSTAPGFHLANDHHLIIGPYVEVRLPLGFSVEGDALYETTIFDSVYTGGSSWQFPVVAKYRFFKGIIRPYVEGGVAFSHITDLANIPALNHTSNYGVVLGGGIEAKLLFLRISPEIRYYEWAFQNIDDPLGQFKSKRNQATFEVGFGF